MSNEKATALAIMPQSIDETTALAERLSQSSLLPTAMRGKMPDVLVTIMAGAEMGLPPMASLRAFHVIEGRPVLSADGMVAIVLGSGKAKYFERVEESDTSVTYETCRVGTDKPRRCTWTIQMAKNAALHLKDNWRAYPRAMLASRAKAELARDVFSDVLMGCYTDDEIDSSNRSAYVAPPKSDVIDVEIVSEAPQDAPELAAIEAAVTPQDLMAQLKTLSVLPNPLKKIARERYAAKMKKLEEQPAEKTVIDVPAAVESVS